MKNKTKLEKLIIKEFFKNRGFTSKCSEGTTPDFEGGLAVGCS